MNKYKKSVRYAKNIKRSDLTTELYKQIDKFIYKSIGSLNGVDYKNIRASLFDRNKAHKRVGISKLIKWNSEINTPQNITNQRVLGQKKYREWKKEKTQKGWKIAEINDKSFIYDVAIPKLRKYEDYYYDEEINKMIHAYNDVRAKKTKDDSEEAQILGKELDEAVWDWDAEQQNKYNIFNKGE